MSTATLPAAERELRYALIPITDLEVRDGTSNYPGTFTIAGYAAVTEQATTLYDSRFYQWNEVISRGAFLPALSRGGLDVHLNIGHDMNRAIARTGVDGVGRLELTEDDTGLRMFARVDATDPDVMALAPKMRNGIMDQASFMFTVARDEVTVATDAQGREVELRRILEIGDLYDVCVCARGAYPQTSANLRSLMAAIQGRNVEPLGQGLVAPSEPVDTHVGQTAPSEPAGEFIRQRDRDAYELRLRLARIKKRMNH